MHGSAGRGDAWVRGPRRCKVPRDAAAGVSCIRRAAKGARYGGLMGHPEIVDIGELPPLGAVPRKMNAQTIRPERFGSPREAFRSEVVDVPAPGPGEVLVAVMAAGVNHNNIWAAQGYPVDVVAQ